jgi:hypothetical protein
MVQSFGVNGERCRHRLLPGEREGHVIKVTLARDPRFIITVQVLHQQKYAAILVDIIDHPHLLIVAIDG